MNQEPERDCMPDEDDAIVHYAPGEHPLCGSESMTAVYTDDPALVSGCPDGVKGPVHLLENRSIHFPASLAQAFPNYPVILSSQPSL